MSEEREPSQSSTKSSNAHHRRRRRWWHALIILLPVCIGIGWHWWSHQLDFRLIGIYEDRIELVKNPVYAVMLKLTTRIPKLHQSALRTIKDSATIKLYERPGILRAQLRFLLNKPLSDSRYFTYRGHRFERMVPELSPDGRHMVLHTDEETLVFDWKR